MPSQKMKMLLLSVVFVSSGSFCWANAQPAAQVSTSKNPSLDLLMAILKDDAALVRSAMWAGANLNQEIGGRKPLVIAVTNFKYQAFEALLELGADFNIMCDGYKLVHYCIMNGRTYYNNSSCNTNCGSSCGTACTTGSCETSCGSCTTECSSGENSINPAVLLIKKGADISGWPPENSIFFYPIFKGDLDLITALINIGYDTNQIDNSTLVYLAHNTKVLELFLKNEFNPNQIIKDEQSTGLPCTALTMAITRMGLASIKLLIAAGADVNLAAPKTPISYAIGSGNIEIIELLIAHGAQL